MREPDDKKSGADRMTRQQAIGLELRDVFGRLNDEPIPDALRDLAAQLDEKLSKDRAPVRLSLVPSSVQNPEDEKS